jgi:hypothetical protein
MADSTTFEVTSEKLDEVIRDLELITDSPGATVFFIVDPFEVVEFCFPVDPTSFQGVEIDKIAHAQAALYEILCLRDVRPVLLPEYSDEIARYLEFLEHTASEVYSSLDMLKVFIDQGKLDISSVETAETSKGDALLEYLKDNFNVVLSVAMGMYSFGADRFRQMAKRLQPIDALDEVIEADRPAILQLIRAYKPSPVSQYIYDQLIRDIDPKNTLAGSRQLRAAQRDARAIDFLTYLNGAAEKALLRGDTQQRYLFLYFSSARRTERIFGLERVRAALPFVTKQRYQFWRTRSQIFAYAFNKSGKENYLDSMRETIDKLKKYKRTLHELANLDSRSASAQRGTELQLQLNEVESYLRGRRPEIENLGLLARIQTYKQLAEKRPTQKQLLPYFEFFKELHDNAQLGDQALERMFTLQRLVVVRSQFAAMVPRALQEQEARQEDSGWVGGTISSASQRLPIRPNLSDERCKSIISIITACYRTPLSHREKRIELFDAAYKSFLELDALHTENTEEHELVRCMLYLAMPTREGIDKAYELLVKQLLHSDSGELKYVFIWAARLAKHFLDGDEVGKRAQLQYPTDPRFPHGRLLNMFEWLREQQSSCPYTLSDVVQQTELALSLYQNQADTLKEELGVIHNDLAYLRSFDPQSGVYDLTIAEENLFRLKNAIPKGEWDPFYPEYFHTEAHLRFEQFNAKVSKEDRPETSDILKELIESARENIDAAIKLNNKPSYAQLKRDIKEAARQLKQSTRDAAQI